MVIFLDLFFWSIKVTMHSSHDSTQLNPFVSPQFTKRARCLDTVAHVVDAILDREPSILDATASNGDTALHFACYEDNPFLVQVLLKRGCKVNVRNEIGF